MHAHTSGACARGPCHHPRPPCFGLGLYGCLFACFYVITAILSVQHVKRVLITSTDKHGLAITIAMCSVILTVPLSVYHIFQHLSHFVEPHLQSQVVRIIWMVPMYAVQSLLSLIYIQHSFYFQAIREAYEAYVIYSFLRYLLYFLGEEKQLEQVLATKPSSLGRHMCPFCCLSSWTMGSDFLNNCKFGVFQYVVLRFSTTVIVFTLRYFDMFDEGHYSWNSSSTWIMVIDLFSQSWALYTLFLFYHATHKELAPLKPFAKFMCIKTVVFFSWWQALVIGFLVQQGAIGDLEEQHRRTDDSQGIDTHTHSAQEVADGIQELLICMEMVVAAVAFYFAFPVGEYSEIPLQQTLASMLPLLKRSNTNELRGAGATRQLHQKHKRSEDVELRRIHSNHLRDDTTFVYKYNQPNTDEMDGDISRELLRLEMQTGMGVSTIQDVEEADYAVTRRPPSRSNEPTTPTVLEALWTSSVPVELEEDLRTLGTQVVDGYIKPGPKWLYRKWVRTQSHMLTDVQS